MLFNFIYKPRFFVLFIVRTITQTWSDIYTLKINEQFTRSKVTKSAICNFPRAPLARFFVFFIEETITQTWSDIYTWKKNKQFARRKVTESAICNFPRDGDARETNSSRYCVGSYLCEMRNGTLHTVRAISEHINSSVGLSFREQYRGHYCKYGRFEKTARGVIGPFC